MFGDDFMGNPKNSGYYDMLKFAIYCPYISALGVKNNKTKGKQCLGRLNIFLVQIQANNL